MTTMYLMTGLSGSGKTTFAKDFSDKNNIRYICIDDFYKATFGTDQVHEHEFDVWMMFYRAINIAIEDKVDVVIDTNSPTFANRKELVDWFGYGFDKKYLIFTDTPYEQCRENNKKRSRVVPDDEFQRMVERYEKPSEDDYKLFNLVLTVNNNEVIKLN